MLRRAIVAKQQRKKTPASASSPVPKLTLYEQVAEKIKSDFIVGRPAGERLPSELHLTERYGVSRVTLRLATDILSRQGKIVRRQGKGTFVSTRQTQINLGQRFRDSLVQDGLKVDIRVLFEKITTPPSDVASQFDSAEKKIIQTRRLVLLDARPVAVMETFTSQKAMERADSFYPLDPDSKFPQLILKQCDYSVWAEPAGSGRATLLGVSPSTVLLLCLRTGFLENAVAEIGIVAMLPDVGKFVVNGHHLGSHDIDIGLRSAMA
jgi:GntR family transcriptional regulator